MEELRIFLGKYFNDYAKRQDYTQIINVSRIIIQPLYQDVAGNFGSDLAILILEEPAKLSEFVRPVCVDWHQKYIKAHLEQDNLGLVKYDCAVYFW